MSPAVRIADGAAHDVLGDVGGHFDAAGAGGECHPIALADSPRRKGAAGIVLHLAQKVLRPGKPAVDVAKVFSVLPYDTAGIAKLAPQVDHSPETR